MKKILILPFFCVFLLSCKDRTKKENEIVQNAAENAESSFSIKRMSSTQNILDGIYSELMKKDPKLKELDEKVNSIQKDSRIMKNIYSDIISNSDSYYQVAESRAKGIQDSILKKEVLNLVKNSSESFTTKKAKIEELTKQINLNYQKIYSFYDAVKIKKTLPEIEKYQKNNPLKSDSLTNYISKQNQLLEQLKNVK